MKGKRLKVKRYLSLAAVFGVCVMVVMSLMAGCQDAMRPTARAIADNSALTGEYLVRGIGLSHVKYGGEVDVEELADGSLSLEWRIDGQKWSGKGSITEDGKLFVVYTGFAAGDGTWVLMSNNELHGEWREEGIEGFATEVWVRK